MRRISAVVLVTLVTGLLAVLGAAPLAAQTVAPVAAQSTGWTITSFDVRVEVDEDASLLVTEEIAVDFGSLERHGIFRDIPVRYEVPSDPWYELPNDAAPADLLRVLEIDDIEVSSPDAPDQVEVTRPGAGPDASTMVRIRIGDPDVTVSGQHTYVLRYRVQGAMNEFDGVPELSWNATGTEWAAPIEHAVAVVAGAGQIVDATCFRGGFGSATACAAEVVDGQVRAESRDLSSFAGMTVAARYEPGTLEVPPPLLTEKWSLANAFVGSTWAIPLTVLTAVLAAGGVGLLLYRQGRDRVASGTVSVDGKVREPREQRRRLFAPRTVPVRFRPPQDLRPGLLGLIVDERVDPVDISATVVDLAVRGHLRIEEVETEVLWFSRTDWRFMRTDPGARPDVTDVPGPVAGDTDGPAVPARDGLMEYEQLLLDGLFEDGEEVLLSELRGEFASTYEKVQRAIYDSGQKRWWFASRPDTTRTRWLGIGGFAVVASIGLLIAAAMFTQIALAVVPLLVASVVLGIGNRWMPHRTARGSQLLTEALGFKEFIVTAEADRMDFAERERLFTGYLPYAVVFGAVDHWAATFADLGVDLERATAGFYHGTTGFHAHQLSASMSDFSSTVGTALATTPSSGGGGSGFSGGGFSGGGMGGGGGGSW